MTKLIVVLLMVALAASQATKVPTKVPTFRPTKVPTPVPTEIPPSPCDETCVGCLTSEDCDLFAYAGCFFSGGLCQPGSGLKLTVDSIESLTTTSYSVSFGYEYDGSATLQGSSIQDNYVLNVDSSFGPGHPDRGQPTEFLPGKYTSVFSVTFEDGSVVWNVFYVPAGTDRAVNATVTATVPTP